MLRLVTFGCSFVYGHGLIDCYEPPNLAGPKPSNYAWPSLLAKKLDRDCLNLSEPGASNLEILLKILDTTFYQDDLVVVGYSFFDRCYSYKMISKENLGTRLSKIEFKQVIESQFSQEHFEENKYWRNWLYIHHAESFLNSRGIKNFSYLNEKVDPPKLLTLNNLLDISVLFKDLALDNQHPGMVSHKLQAQQIYSKIAEHELR